MVSLEEKALATYEAEMVYACGEAEAKGEARGEAKGEAKLILGMLSRGHSPQAVADFTGIPLSRIEQVISYQVDKRVIVVHERA
jgi:hypothetical protein